MDGNGATWLGLAIAIVSMIGTAVTAITTAVVKVAQARADRKAAGLEAQNQEQAGQIQALTDQNQQCQDAHTETRTRLEECRDKHETTEVRLKDIETALAALGNK